MHMGYTITCQLATLFVGPSATYYYAHGLHYCRPLATLLQASWLHHLQAHRLHIFRPMDYTVIDPLVTLLQTLGYIVCWLTGHTILVSRITLLQTNTIIDPWVTLQQANGLVCAARFQHYQARNTFVDKFLLEVTQMAESPGLQRLKSVP